MHGNSICLSVCLSIYLSILLTVFLIYVITLICQQNETRILNLALLNVQIYVLEIKPDAILCDFRKCIH